MTFYDYEQCARVGFLFDSQSYPLALPEFFSASFDAFS